MTHYHPSYNLLLVDDHQLMIDGLLGILKEEKLIENIYTCNNGKDAIDQLEHCHVDCVLMDINMPGLNGLEATKIIKERRQDIKVIIISMLSDAPVVIKLLKAGADGFIVKNTGREELVRAIEKVMNHEKYISNELNLNLYNHLSLHKSHASSVTSLTSRETEIIRYIADGMTNHEIADKLFLSPSTVDTHRKNILAKLGLKNSAALVKYAAENNLL